MKQTLGLISIMTDEGEPTLEGEGHMLGMLMARVHERSRPVPLRLALGQKQWLFETVYSKTTKNTISKGLDKHTHFFEKLLCNSNRSLSRIGAAAYTRSNHTHKTLNRTSSRRYCGPKTGPNTAWVNWWH